MTPQDAPAGTAEVPLLPPNPNPGPEPWSEPPGLGPAALIGAGVAAGLVLIGVFVVVSRRRKRRRTHEPRSEGPPPVAALDRAADASLSARDRLLARAEAVREALIVAFGPAWAARTTEEIAEAPEPAERLGPERAAEVVALLLEADRVKFAGIDDHRGLEEASWVPEVVARLAEGASSSKSGK